MAEFCSEDINFDIPFDELMRYLLNERKFSLHLKWLYDILTLWKSELEAAAIFEEEEIKVVLPKFLKFICTQFCTTFADYQCLHRCLKDEVKQRYEVYKTDGWKCLLDDVTDRTSKCKEQKKSAKSEPNENMMSKSFTIFSGDEISELENFTEKYEFLLSLLFKNKFNTIILNTAMKHRFEVYKLQFPHSLSFPRPYLAPPEKKGKAADADSILVSILPLQMAQEINSDFWNIYK